MAKAKSDASREQLAEEEILPEYLKEPHGEDEPVDEEPATLAAPPVRTLLEVPAPGLYGTHNDARRYGIAKTIQILRKLGETWSARHQNIRIGIGDISKRGGGPLSGHRSHQRGVDVDIRPLRRDGKELPIRYQQREYSLALTQELIDLLHGNGILPVTHLFFNDPKATRVRTWPHHDNHLHVRFRLPPR